MGSYPGSSPERAGFPETISVLESRMDSVGHWHAGLHRGTGLFLPELPLLALSIPIRGNATS